MYIFGWPFQIHDFDLILVFTCADFSLFLLFRISSAALLILEADGIFFLVLRRGFVVNSSCRQETVLNHKNLLVQKFLSSTFTWSFSCSSWRNHTLKLSWPNRENFKSSSVLGLFKGSTYRQDDIKFNELSVL